MKTIRGAHAMTTKLMLTIALLLVAASMFGYATVGNDRLQRVAKHVVGLLLASGLAVAIVAIWSTP